MQKTNPTSWSDYRTLVREFDAVLEHGKALSAAWAGTQRATPQAIYAEQIYLKLVAHCIALRRVASDPMLPMPLTLAELPSTSALAHCVIEAFDAFEYVAGHAVNKAESGFRIRLWELHDATRRLKMLEATGAHAETFQALRVDAERLREILEGHEVMAALPAALRAELLRRFACGEPPAFHLDRRQRCALSGIDSDWHQTATQQLSQHVHTLPFSAHHLMQLEPGSPESLHLLAQPFTVALPCLARAIHAAASFMPVGGPQPPSRTARTIQAWRAVNQATPAAPGAA